MTVAWRKGPAMKSRRWMACHKVHRVLNGCDFLRIARSCARGPPAGAPTAVKRTSAFPQPEVAPAQKSYDNSD